MTFPNQLALISPADLQKLVEDSMRKVLTEKGEAAPPALLGIDEAADYLGIGKRKFQYLLKEHPDLDVASIYIGARRLWRRITLDAWVARQEEKGQPKKREAA